jgi:fumarate reductase subunit C
MPFRLYIAQRASAALMVPLILGHLAIIFYASGHDLTATEILGRTRNSLGWGLYYTAFVVLAAIHGAIGVRGVLREWGPPMIVDHARRLDGVMWAIGSLLLLLGLRAVYAVVIA